MFCYIQQLILSYYFSLFPVTEHFILRVKWEKICNSVQIGGIVMFNNLCYYVKMFCWNLHRFLFVYAGNYSS